MSVHVTAEDGVNTLRGLVWPWVVLALYIGCYGFALYIAVAYARPTMHVICPPWPHGPLTMNVHRPSWIHTAVPWVRTVMAASVVIGLLGPLWSSTRKKITSGQAARLAVVLGTVGLIMLVFVFRATHAATLHSPLC
jgi:hypothetical protein